MNKTIEALTRAYQEVTEKLVGNQHKLDTNGNGKIDGDDFKKLKSKKKSGKDDPTSNNGETATMNPKSSTQSGTNEAVKSADKKPEKYIGRDGKTHVRMVPVDKEVVKKESTDMSIRDKLLSVLERKDEHYKSATEAEPMDNNLKGGGAKKMKADIAGNSADPDLEKKGHDDAAKAGRATKVSAKNTTDKDAPGDKNVVNPVKDTTKVGKGDPVMKESFAKTVKSIGDSYKSMYEPKVEEEKTDENYAGNYGSSVASYGKEQDHKNRYEKENPGKKWKDLPWGHQDSLSKHYNKNPA